MEKCTDWKTLFRIIKGELHSEGRASFIVSQYKNGLKVNPNKALQLFREAQERAKQTIQKDGK